MKEEFVFFVGEQYRDAIEAVRNYFLSQLEGKEAKVLYIRKGDIEEIAEDIVQEIFMMKGLDT